MRVDELIAVLEKFDPGFSVYIDTADRQDDYQWPVGSVRYDGRGGVIVQLDGHSYGAISKF